MRQQGLHEEIDLRLQRVHGRHRPRPETVLVLQPYDGGGVRVFCRACQRQAQQSVWGGGQLERGCVTFVREVKQQSKMKIENYELKIKVRLSTYNLCKSPRAMGGWQEAIPPY
jgi:hypothetical protein